MTGKGAKEWRLYTHPAFAAKFTALVNEVEGLREREPRKFRNHPKAKLLRRILDLIEIEIPRDPSAPEYALGNTLGPQHRHWRRAKFLGRFRLFFRYSSKDRIIIYAWMNDEASLRQAGGRNDPYALFGSLLRKGQPPEDWAALMKMAEPLRNPK